MSCTKVAVIDSGVDLNHPDLIDNLLEGYDAVDDSQYEFEVCCGEYETDLDWHGTCCAGIIGAANNSIGMVGVAHTSKIIPIRYGHYVLVYFKDFPPDHPTWHWVWRGKISWIVDAFNHACYVDNADVISCSFGTRVPSNVLDSKVTEICRYGRDGKGCVVVAGSGNTYNNISSPIWDTLGYLARHPSVISVGSVTPCGKRVVYGKHCDMTSDYNSCYGDSLDVVAPGIRIPTTTINDEYTEAFAGTSSATPHVAGIAALILSVNPCLTREEVKYIIESTCTKVRQDVYTYGNNPDHTNGTWNIEVGYGLVNAGAAVALAQQMGGYTYFKDTVVSSVVTWSDNIMINSNLIIDSLATLTIMDTLYIANNSRIIVRPGGKLVVDGGTLTSACSGEMWQGIELVGDRTKRQLAQYQGTVELRNGAIIENAHCAIKTRLGDDNWHTTGGIIKADSALFINNRRSVEFLSYTNQNAGGGIIGNQSYFNRCTFKLDDNNLFALNNSTFIDHVTMWEVRKVKFMGCKFSNETTDSSGDRRHGIYSLDAGFTVDTYCSQIYNGCECPENNATNSTFSGFATAVEVNTSGIRQSVEINRAEFTNNEVGVSINGNHHAIITRNRFDMTTPKSDYPAGLVLNNCTSYKVEGNTFEGVVNYADGFTTGILVNNNNSYSNIIYRDTFNTLTYGVRALMNNSGVVASCNTFDGNWADIYVCRRSTLASSQGSSQTSAGNMFYRTDGFNILNDGVTNINYYYSGTPTTSNIYYPSMYSGIITPYTSMTANFCISTLCTGIIPNITGFQSDMNAFATATSNQSPADVTDGSGVNVTLSETARVLSETYYTAVRALMADSVLDLNELEQWHTVAQPIADPYSLTETRFMMGYDEPFVNTDADDAELANYADFHAMKVALRNNFNDNMDNADNNISPDINWYALTPSQIAQLQTIAERNAGRASVMAKGVLCFFFGICYDDEWGNAGVFDTPQQGDDTTSTRAKRTAMDAAADAVLNVYPNPTDDILYVELSGAGIKSVGLYDLQGRVVGANNYSPQQGIAAIINVRSVPAGVYVLRVTDENGKEYHRKVVVR